MVSAANLQQVIQVHYWRKASLKGCENLGKSLSGFHRRFDIFSAASLRQVIGDILPRY